MRVPRIFQASSIEIGSQLELERAASHHLTRVLRLKQDSAVTVFNGEGGEYLAWLQIEGKKAFVVAKEFHQPERESSLDIHLLQGVSKGERMDFSIQKAVELGVTAITPVVCQRTVVNLKNDRMDKKVQHWRGIVISACEQSGRNLLPELNAPVPLNTILRPDIAELKLTMDPVAGHHLGQIDADHRSIALLIGPEGGLTETEIDRARNVGFQGIRLGPRILRTETAALAAITALQTRWGDFS